MHECYVFHVLEKAQIDENTKLNKLVAILAHQSQKIFTYMLIKGTSMWKRGILFLQCC